MKKVLIFIVILSLVFGVMSTSAALVGNNPEVSILFDFEDGTLGGWQVVGPADTPIEVRPLGENNNALCIDYEYKDLEEKTWWDCVNIRCDGNYDMTGVKAICYDVTFAPSSFVGYGSIRTYGATYSSSNGFKMYNPHDIAKTEIDVQEGELITVKCYSTLETEITSASQLFVYIVGAAIDYDGPLYVDNIGFVYDLDEPADAQKITLNRTTPVQRNGYLQVIGTNLCNQNGEPVQLKGMNITPMERSQFVNRALFQALAYDWKCDVVRLAISLGDYDASQEKKDLICKCIDYAIETGMYVLLDWHVLSYGDPLDPQNGDAAAFFDEFSRLYKDVPNVIYEICNEPNGTGVTWDNNIKPYAEKIIPVIRNNAPNSIVVVGTANWSQDVDLASLNPLDFENVMYTVHFYAKTHTQKYRDKVITALANGLPIFATEWGITAHTGADGVDMEQTELWLELLEEHNISWANWLITLSSGETSALHSLVLCGEQNGIKVCKKAPAIPANVSVEGYRYWSEAELSFGGNYVRNYILSRAVDDEILPLAIENVSVNDSRVVVTASGGKNILYSYYLLRDGKVYEKSVFTSSNTYDIKTTESGTYRLRVYAQTASNNRVVSEISIVI